MPLKRVPQKRAGLTNGYCYTTPIMKSDVVRRLLLIGMLAASVWLGVSCRMTPETGRRTFQIVPEARLQGMAAAQFNTMRREAKVSNDPALTARMQALGRRVVAASGSPLPADKWEFVVFKDDAVNAFAMPGGKVGVFTGLIDQAGSDDEIAVVIGHEVAHVTLRHSNERMSQALAVMAATYGAQYAVKSKEAHIQNAVMLAVGLGSQVGVLLPYSRVHEREADRIGLLYAARAGFDPRAAITFWERTEAQAKQSGTPPEFLSTHPSTGNRIRELQRMMPEALEAYEASVPGNGI